MGPREDSISAFSSGLAEVNRHAVAIVLIGSVARSAETPKSDVDLLVIGEQDPVIPPVPDNFHVHASSQAQFVRKLASGDDLAAWCVRYGITIQDPGLWKEIISAPEANTWPRWQNKILHAARRLMLATALLETADVEAAAEETLFATGHVARALLLRANVFPLARAELIGQTREIGFRSLSAMLDGLLFGEPDDRFVRRTIQYLKKLLINLDKDEFAQRSKDLARMAPKAKRRRGTSSGENRAPAPTG